MTRSLLTRSCAGIAQVASGVLLAIAGAGCGGTELQTCEVATEDISAVALVIDSGRDIRAAVDFEQGDRRGRGAPLYLCETDRLTVNGQRTTEIDKASRVEYALSLPAESERSFRFELLREDEGDRITFDVELPAALEILTPMEYDPVAVEQDQLIEWEPAVEGSTLQVEMSEDLGGNQCVIAEGEGHTYEQGGGVQVDDTGQWTIPAGTLQTDSPEPCVARYTLTRVARGDYPTVLQRGGRVEARVERYREVIITP